MATSVDTKEEHFCDSTTEFEVWVDQNYSKIYDEWELFYSARTDLRSFLEKYYPWVIHRWEK